jgi:phage shock protein A
MAWLDERSRWDERLSAAIAEEHRLHEAAAREEAAARRWEARAALAARKEAPDLAEAARQRMAQHQRRAQSYRAESVRQQAHIAELKAALLQPGPAVRPPLVVVEGVDPVARRLAALEREERLERDLAELKRQLGRQ